MSYRIDTNLLTIKTITIINVSIMCSYNLCEVVGDLES